MFIFGGIRYWQLQEPQRQEQSIGCTDWVLTAQRNYKHEFTYSTASFCRLCWLAARAQLLLLNMYAIIFVPP